MSEYKSNVESIPKIKYQIRKNYGGFYRLGSDSLACYTKKQLKSFHPTGDFEIVGEFAPNSKSGQIGTLEGDRKLPIFPYKSNNRFLFREKGYLALEDGDDKYIVLLQKVLPQRITALAVCAAVAICGSVLALQMANPVTLPENSVPAAAASLNLDPNAVNLQSAQPSAEGSVTQGIAIPGFKNITIDANSIDEKVNFSNPKDNPCYFEISLLLEDGTVLYKSAMIKPGQAIYSIKLNKALKAGTYNAMLKYDTYSLNGLAPMNGAAVKISLIAQ